MKQVQEYEKTLVGILLNKREEAEHVLLDLKQDYFRNPLYNAIYKEIESYYAYKKRMPAPNLVAFDLSQDGEQDADKIVKTICLDTQFYAVENAEELAQLLKRRYLECKFKAEIAQADAEQILEMADRLQSDLKQSGSNTGNVLEYLKSGFEKELEEARNTPILKTGLDNFDEELTGIYSGLYVVGAISSLGKTTLIHQIADNIASAGTPVLYFSLEMSRLELITKSIARLTAQNEQNTVSERKTALYWRTHGINTEAGKTALKAYTDTIADNMNIIQGDFGTDVLTVRADVQRFIRQNPNKPKPIVIIDYLQALKPADERKTTKDSIDFTVTELKRISRDFNIPVVVISSFNRANYMTSVSFESFKESGGIEYTADVVIGLQLECVTSDVFDKDGDINKKRKAIKDAKATNPRRINLQVLKNRYGNASTSITLEYNPQYDLFAPAKEVFNIDDKTPKGYSPRKNGKIVTKY